MNRYKLNAASAMNEESTPTPEANSPASSIERKVEDAAQSIRYVRRRFGLGGLGAFLLFFLLIVGLLYAKQLREGFQAIGLLGPDNVAASSPATSTTIVNNGVPDRGKKSAGVAKNDAPPPSPASTPVNDGDGSRNVRRKVATRSSESQARYPARAPRVTSSANNGQSCSVTNTINNGNISQDCSRQ